MLWGGGDGATIGTIRRWKVLIDRCLTISLDSFKACGAQLSQRGFFLNFAPVFWRRDMEMK
jgi:hypothetical protein